MQISVVTLMPEFVRSALSFGVIGQALSEGRWALDLVNPREFTNDVHQTVDDRVFGGGDGMLMMAEPLARAIERVRADKPASKVIHLSPRGIKFTDRMAREWAKKGDPLVFVASRYAGADERFIREFCDLEVSVGDFVVSGGDLPAALLVDAVLRHVPGVLGNQASAEHDSFSDGIFESAQYTRPREWRGLDVPSALVTGDPIIVDQWRFLEALQSTIEKRADLIEALGFSRQRAISTKIQAIDLRAQKELRAKHDERPQATLRRQANNDILGLVRAISKPWERLMMSADERREKSSDKSGTPR